MLTPPRVPRPLFCYDPTLSTAVEAAFFPLISLSERTIMTKRSVATPPHDH